MSEIKIIDVKRSILEDNDADAEALRAELKKSGTFYLNLMSSPGSGKTSTILSLIPYLRDDFRIAVMEADIDSDVDARRILSESQIPAVQLHTGGMCHLDADMSRQGLNELNAQHPEGFDLVILENVGNLVCPAEFDTGAVKNVCILSVPEGDDKPLKYPLMFEIAHAVLINKMDTLSVFDFDPEKAESNIHMRNGSAAIFRISAKKQEGIRAFAEWLKAEISEWRSYAV